MGVTNYYHTYVERYAHYAAPLMENLKLSRDLAKKNSKARLKWTPDGIQAFETLTLRLTKQLSLQMADPDGPFILKVDASDYAIGGILEQLPRGHPAVNVWPPVRSQPRPRQFQWHSSVEN